MFQAENMPDWSMGKALKECPSNISSIDPIQCLGTGLMVRISFILLLFHLFVFLVTLGRNGYAASFHDGCWAFKFSLVASAYVASLWMSNEDIFGYMNVCFYLGTVFLVY